MFNLFNARVKFRVITLIVFWGGTYGKTINSNKRITRTNASFL